LRDPAQLFFLSADSAIRSVVELNDTVNNVLEGENGWYVSTKTGWLYAFSGSGRRRWMWQCPESVDSYRAVPLYVCIVRNGIVAGSAGELHGLSPRGTVLWRSELPDRPERRYKVEVPDPAAGHVRDRSVELLGLSGTDLAQSVEIGQLRQIFSSEPAGWFGAERPLSLVEQEEDNVLEQEVEVEMCLGGSIWAESLVHVGEHGETVLAGTSAGRACFFDPSGNFLGDCGVGRYPVCASADLGRAGAVYCGGVLTLLHRQCAVASLQFPAYDAELAAQGSNVLVWSWQQAWLVNSHGDLIWNATFPRRIGAVFADHDSFSILAGALYRFQVRSSASGVP